MNCLDELMYFRDSYGGRCVIVALIDDEYFGYNIDNNNGFQISTETYNDWVGCGSWEVLNSLNEPAKTPEQLLAAERFAHYKAKLEAAKKDMEYWEEKL